MVNPFSILVAALAFASSSVAIAQNSPALIEQVPMSQGTTPQIRGTSGSSASERLPTSTPQPQPPRQAGSVSPEVIAACESQDNENAQVAGVDCTALLQALSQPGPAPSAEQSLLGALRPDGNANVPSGQRTANMVNADDVARRASTGDVQNPGASDAIGAIVQQGGPR